MCELASDLRCLVAVTEEGSQVRIVRCTNLMGGAASHVIECRTDLLDAFRADFGRAQAAMQELPVAGEREQHGFREGPALATIRGDEVQARLACRLRRRDGDRVEVREVDAPPALGHGAADGAHGASLAAWLPRELQRERRRVADVTAVLRALEMDAGDVVVRLRLRLGHRVRLRDHAQHAPARRH